MLEVAWSRSLSLSLGNSSQAIATVVASMMMGLCLGSLAASRLLHRRLPNPARAYGAVEIGIGCFAALTPLIFRILPAALDPLYELPLPLFTFLRFLIVFTLLLPASAGMGATLPLATAALSRLPFRTNGRGDAGAASLGGMLYGLNTLGAFAGTLAAGFVLLPSLGLLRTTLLAAAISATVGAAAWSLSRAPLARREAAPAAGARSGERRARWILPLYAASGCLSMIFEITWTRALSPLVGTSVYSFTLILGAILAGIGAGSLLLSRRRLEAVDPARAFAAGELLLALCAFLSTWGLGAFPELLLRALAGTGAGPASILLREFLLFAGIVLPPALLLGGLFPFAARLVQRVDPEAGAEVGKAYAWNTAGGIAGSLAAGFLLVEALGSERLLVLAAAASALVALGAVALAEGRRFRLAAGAIAAGMALLFPFLVPAWDLYRMTSGVTQLVRHAAAGGGGAGLEELRKLASPPGAEVAFHREGRSSTVTVVREKGYVFLRVDGKADASTLPADMLTQVLLGQLPFLFAPADSDACVIGYGSGVTSRAVLTHPVRRLDTLEIERQVIEASPFFETANLRPLSDPRSRLILDDARTALAYRPDRYDVIISEPSNPWMAGVNNLFTSEFYALARRRLKPGGIFCQWVQAYEMSGRSLQVILDTVSRSFPCAHLFASRLGADMLVLASDRPLSLAPGAAALFPDRPEVAEDLARVGIYAFADLALRYTAPLPPPDPGAVLNTDDNSLIQYRAPLDLIRFEEGAGPLRRIPLSIGALLALFYPGRGEAEALPEVARAARRLGAGETVEAIASYLEKKGHGGEAKQVLAMTGSPAPAAEGPGSEGFLAQAEERVLGGDAPGALAALERAEALGLRSAEENSRAGFVYLKVRRFAEAEKRLDAAASDPSSPLLYRSLAGRGAVRYRLGRRAEGLADIAAAKAMNPDDPLAYLLLGWAYREVNEPGLARRELEDGLRKAPGDPRLVRALAGVSSP